MLFERKETYQNHEHKWNQELCARIQWYGQFFFSHDKNVNITHSKTPHRLYL